MMRISPTLRGLLALTFAIAAASAVLAASGPIGIYGIVSRVVFEPSEKAPERLQVWGAFAYADGGPQGSGAFSIARKGYLYFALPTGDARLAETVLKEWMDLKAVAGTGQAVGFGTWGYVGVFPTDPSVKSPTLEMYPNRGVSTDLRVRPEAEKPATPSVYQTNVGLVRIPAAGSRADLVKRLQLALEAR